MGAAEIAFTDPNDVFQKHEKEVAQTLRSFKNLHWQPHHEMSTKEVPGAAAAARTIPFLKVRLLAGGGHKHRQHQIPGLHPPPLVQLFVVGSVTLEEYRKQIRPLGREWLNTQVHGRDVVGYVVVHAAGTDEKQRKAAKAVWSRITSEFDAENCMQLAPQSEASWRELHMLVQRELVRAFDARVEMLEQEIEKLHATRNMPGWNFGTLFVVNESLASAYESLNLIDGALDVYRLLENLISTVPKQEWAKAPVSLKMGINTSRDALIEPMLTQTMSHFDFLRHIVACQVRLFFALASGKHQIRENIVDSKTDQYAFDAVRTFVVHVPALMTELTASVGQQTANAWLLRSMKELYDLTAEFGSSKFANGKGDILLIQRDALQSIAVCHGWEVPGVLNNISLVAEETAAGDASLTAKSTASSASSSPSSSSSSSGGNAEQQQQQQQQQPQQSVQHLAELSGFPELQDETSFCAEFVKLTKTALNYFRVAGMRRTVTRLSGQLALIEYSKKNYEAAWDIFQKSPLSLQPERAIHEHSASLLGMSMDCALQLNLADKVMECAWRIVTLDTKVPLSLYIEAIGHINRFDSTTPLHHELNKWFVPKFLPYVQGDGIGYFVEITLLPKHRGFPFIQFENASMMGTCTPVFGPQQAVAFETATIDQDENNNRPIKLKLYTKTFVDGMLSFSGFNMVAGNQMFSHSFDTAPVVTAMRPLSSALNTCLKLGKKYTMRKRNIELQIQSPTTVSSAHVQIQPTDQAVQLLLPSNETSTSEGLENFTETSISIPVLVNYSSPRSTFRIFVQYDDGRTYESHETVDFSLLVSVDFQEYYREPPKIFLQFLVRPFQLAPITFSKAELTSSSSYEVSSEFGASQHSSKFVGYVNAPVSYIFSLRKTSDSEADKNKAHPMQLTLSYRSIIWEIRHIIYGRLIEGLKELDLSCYARTASRVAESLSDIADMEAFVIESVVKIDSSAAIKNVVDKEFQNMNPNHVEAISAKVTSLLEQPIDKTTLPGEEFEKLDSEITLEVPDPDASVVHYVKLYSKETNTYCTVGQVLPMELEIDTIYIQKDVDENTEYEYLFDRLSDGWSYTGKVTGTFKGTEKVKERLDLIPHRSGDLRLPNVVIRPKKLRSSGSSVASNSSVAERSSESIVVASHANTQILVVPDVNMLAITF